MCMVAASGGLAAKLRPDWARLWHSFDTGDSFSICARTLVWKMSPVDIAPSYLEMVTSERNYRLRARTVSHLCLNGDYVSTLTFVSLVT